MAPVRIELAGEPRGKGRPRFSRASGRAFTPAATRSYEVALRLAAQDAMGDRPPIDGPIVVDIIAWLPIPVSMTKKDRARLAEGLLRPTKKPDVDNLMKCVDALNQIVFADDKQIVRATVEKRYGEKPSLVIFIEELA